MKGMLLCSLQYLTGPDLGKQLQRTHLEVVQCYLTLIRSRRSILLHNKLQNSEMRSQSRTRNIDCLETKSVRVYNNQIGVCRATRAIGDRLRTHHSTWAQGVMIPSV